MRGGRCGTPWKSLPAPGPLSKRITETKPRRGGRWGEPGKAGRAGAADPQYPRDRAHFPKLLEAARRGRVRGVLPIWGQAVTRLSLPLRRVYGQGLPERALLAQDAGPLCEDLEAEGRGEHRHVQQAGSPCWRPEPPAAAPQPAPAQARKLEGRDLGRGQGAAGWHGERRRRWWRGQEARIRVTVAGGLVPAVPAPSASSSL